ncbi:hypothetical protein Bca101_093091 [Brassica carinata]
MKLTMKLYDPIVEENELITISIFYTPLRSIPISSSFGFDGNQRRNTINVTNHIDSHNRRLVLRRSPPYPSLLMSMEPSLLLLVSFSGAELRYGGETSDGAAASHHRRHRVSPPPSPIHTTIRGDPPAVHPMSPETFLCCQRLCRVVNQGEA